MFVYTVSDRAPLLKASVIVTDKNLMQEETHRIHICSQRSKYSKTGIK